MTAANILSDELARTRRLLEHEQAKRIVADMQAQAERDMCDAIAERLSHLLVALADADIAVNVGRSGPDGDEDYLWASFPQRWHVTDEELHNLGEAITAARLGLDEHHEARFGAL